jgi:hypothetical protein
MRHVRLPSSTKSRKTSEARAILVKIASSTNQEERKTTPEGVIHEKIVEEESIIDYRCEDGRFPVCPRCMTISNPDLLSCVKTGINPGVRS